MPDERFFEPDVETMSRDALTALQEASLLDLLPYVYEHGGLLRQLWEAASVHPRDIRSLDDYLERAPFISKHAIRSYRDTTGDPFGGISCANTEHLHLIYSSSGTTGDATLFPDRWERYVSLPRSQARNLWAMGVRPGDHALWSGLLRGPWHQYIQLVGGIPVFVPTWTGEWTDLFEVILRYRPVWMTTGYPQLAQMERLADRYDLTDVFSSFKGVGFAGEPLGSTMRCRVEEWGMPIYLWGPMGDSDLAWECPRHDGLHVWEDNVLVESLDPEGVTAMPEGEVGELVTTALDNRVGPLVRYRTDDLVRMTTEPCGCGRTHARVWIVGRKGEEVVVGGRAILPRDVWVAIEDQPETAHGIFQVVRRARVMDELRLRVGYEPDRTTSCADLHERLRGGVQAAVGVDPVIELVPEADILAVGDVRKVRRVVTA